MQEKNTTNVILFSKRLLKLAEERGLDQKTIARGSGLTQGAISLYMRGLRMPGASELYRLAKFFKVTMESMLQGVPESEITEEEKYSLGPMDLRGDQLPSFAREAGLTMDQLQKIVEHYNEGKRIISPAKSDDVASRARSSTHSEKELPKEASVEDKKRSAVERMAGISGEIEAEKIQRKEKETKPLPTGRRIKTKYSEHRPTGVELNEKKEK